MSTIRVLVVDDHDMFRRGVMEVLEREDDITVIGEARNGQQAIDRAGELSPDVVFMDLNMPGQGGIASTAYLTQQSPEIKVLIQTVSEEAGDLFRAMQVGARGYVLKTASTEEITDALRQVHEGWVVLSPAMAPRLASYLGKNADAIPLPTRSDVDDSLAWHLTNRELEVLQLIARRLTNIEVANELVISENTVKTHIKNILSKLHAKSRREAVAYATRSGLLRTGSDPGPRAG